jgi:hypothetical protein
MRFWRICKKFTSIAKVSLLKRTPRFRRWNPVRRGFYGRPSHYPKPIQSPLPRPWLRPGPAPSWPDSELNPLFRPIDENCDAAFCVDACPFHAISLLEYVRAKRRPWPAPGSVQRLWFLHGYLSQGRHLRGRLHIGQLGAQVDVPGPASEQLAPDRGQGMRLPINSARQVAGKICWTALSTSPGMTPGRP